MNPAALLVAINGGIDLLVRLIGIYQDAEKDEQESQVEIARLEGRLNQLSQQVAGYKPRARPSGQL